MRIWRITINISSSTTIMHLTSIVVLRETYWPSIWCTFIKSLIGKTRFLNLMSNFTKTWLIDYSCLTGTIFIIHKFMQLMLYNTYHISYTHVVLKRSVVYLIERSLWHWCQEQPMIWIIQVLIIYLRSKLDPNCQLFITISQSWNIIMQPHSTSWLKIQNKTATSWRTSLQLTNCKWEKIF